jgi:hypothetical protein
MSTKLKSMESKKIAIITTSKFHFHLYVTKNKLNPENVKQISVLSDIKDTIFDYKLEIEGSNNVTDYVINRVKLRN